MRSKKSYTFEHEVIQSAATKIPKFKVEYTKKQKDAIQQFEQKRLQAQSGEIPAKVDSPNTYQPLVNQVNPLLMSPTIDFFAPMESISKSEIMNNLKGIVF